MTSVIDDAKCLGLARPAVPAELSKIFNDAKEFLISHSDKYARLLDLERTQENATACSAHAGKKLPTADNDAVHVHTSSTRTPSKRMGRGRRLRERDHYPEVTIQLESGEMEFLAYNGSNAVQQARIAYPTQACTTCETAGIICTGPTVGSSTFTLKGQASKTPAPKPERKQTKRKRDDVAIPAPETPEPSIHTEVAAPHQSVQQSSLISPCVKRQKTDAECSMDRNARSPSPSTSRQSALADLQRDLDALISYQTQFFSANDG
ncbi:hypothetical protein SCLCIDRAFT_9539 [Scleroderma citrinum Foug A]|uniref:Uncharacterized protein n=1 Tax=Scleroderma citrinum Foug A TaxID=1036808 RepID=A0A0C3DK51_9AGAM|nr:hypothetical protein SCLCIDRAFT_9539 [Scleroderma citrinum Foug A]